MLEQSLVYLPGSLLDMDVEKELRTGYEPGLASHSPATSRKEHYLLESLFFLLECGKNTLPTSECGCED